MKKSVCVLLCVLFFSSTVCAATAVMEEIAVETLAKTSMSWDGSALPEYPEGKPEVTVLRITIQPGTELPRHVHPVINVGYLTKGELTVIADDGGILRLVAGDSIVELVNKGHYGKNEGDVPAEIVVFYVGTPGEQITVMI